MPRVIYVDDSSAVPPASPHTANEGCVKLTDKAYQDKSHRREYIWAVKETQLISICISGSEDYSKSKSYVKVSLSHSELVPGP